MFNSRFFSMAVMLILTGMILGCGTSDNDPELWIIGLDGADWDQLKPQIQRGELPNLAKLIDEGASGVLLSDTPMISPILWTSISTGVTPDIHGVTWFMTDAPDGSKIPISSEERQVRTFWNIASESGLSCGITGWWATWPAEPINGYLVSDAVAWHSFGITGRGNPAEGKTWPWEMIHEVLEQMPNPAHVSDELMTRLIHLPADQLKPVGDNQYDDPISHLRQAIATSRGYTDHTLLRLEKDRPQVMSIYYEGTDAITHLFSKYMEPALPWIDPAEIEIYKDLVDQYWIWQDQLVGELLAKRGPNTTVMVVSDHGFRRGSERRKEDHFHIETADADHQPDGIIILNGPHIQAAAQVQDADIYDVTPTVLYLLDLPVGRDMVGHPLTETIEANHLRENPVQWKPTWETGPRQKGSATVQDDQTGEDLEKMLRSLGYIAGSEGTKSGDEVDFTFEQVVNLATVLMGQGRTAEAVEKLQSVLAENPGNFEIRLNLAQALYRNGQTEESHEVFQGLIVDFPEHLEVFEDYGLSLRLSKKFAKALTVYDQGLKVSPEWVPGLAGKGLCLAQMGRIDEGLLVLEEARAIDPRDHSVFWNLGLVQQKTGDMKNAAISLKRALELEPTDARTAVALAEVQLQLRESSSAEQTLHNTLAKGGDKALLMAELGSLQLRTGKTEQALKTLTEASKLNRDDLDVLGNLGMAYAMTGNLDSAIEMFQKLTRIDANRADAQAQLGAMQAQNGQLEAAVASVKKAVALDPNNALFRLNLAYALQQKGDSDGAIEQFRRVMELDASIAEAPYGLGRLELARGNSEEGHRLINLARKMKPSLPAP